MAVTCLLLLPSIGRLLCLLSVTVSVLSLVHCSAHTLLGVTLSVLSSVRPDVLGRRSTQTIFSLGLRGRTRSGALLSQSAYTERPTPLLVEEATPLPSSDGTHTHTHTHTCRQEGDHISLL
jgi:hypothetical protein